MNMIRNAAQVGNPISAEAGGLFARTSDGLLVAKVRDNAFAMMPGTNGRFYLASACMLSRPLWEWTSADFYRHGGETSDQAALPAP